MVKKKEREKKSNHLLLLDRADVCEDVTTVSYCIKGQSCHYFIMYRTHRLDFIRIEIWIVYIFTENRSHRASVQTRKIMALISATSVLIEMRKNGI